MGKDKKPSRKAEADPEKARAEADPEKLADLASAGLETSKELQAVLAILAEKLED